MSPVRFRALPSILGIVAIIAILAALLVFRGRTSTDQAVAPPPAKPVSAKPEERAGEEKPKAPRAAESKAIPESHPSEEERFEIRLGEMLDLLRAAVETKSVWYGEIEILMELEDAFFASIHSGRVREVLMGLLTDPESGSGMAALAGFVLTVHPSIESRRELAGLMGKVSAHDSCLLYAVAVQNARAHLSREERIAFWKGCFNTIERSNLVSLGFRARLFKEEYGKSLEKIAQTEFVKPSGADRFCNEVSHVFFKYRKKGYQTWLGLDPKIRKLLVDYVAKGPSPEAKRQICSMTKSGLDLAAAAREAFMMSRPYNKYQRRALLNAAVDRWPNKTSWSTYDQLLPYGGTLKFEMLKRMSKIASGVPRDAGITLGYLKKEIVSGPPGERETDSLIDSVAELSVASSESYLQALARTHPDEKIRTSAVGSLYPGGPGELLPQQYQKRVSWAEEALLSDPSEEVRGIAVASLAWLLSDGGRLSDPEKVKSAVKILRDEDLVGQSEVDHLFELLEKK